MERKNSWRNSAATTCARVAPAAAFKRCCLRTGKFDGTNRDYFFPVSWKQTRKKTKKRGLGYSRILLDFRFLFSYSAGR